MKLPLIAVSAALAGFVSAQGSVPTCAQGCVGALLPASCGLNPACICADSNFITNISCCVAGACPAADQSAALAFASSVCRPAGVTNLPTAASCAPGSTYIVSGSSATGTAASASSTATPASTTVSGSGSSSITSQASTAAATNSGMSSTSSAAAASSTTSRAAGDKLAAQGISLLGAVVGAVALL